MMVQTILRHEDHEFKASLGYIIRSCLRNRKKIINPNPPKIKTKVKTPSDPDTAGKVYLKANDSNKLQS